MKDESLKIACKRCKSLFLKTTSDRYCDNCKSIITSKFSQSITKDNKKNLILHILQEYGDYCFNKSLDMKMVELKLLNSSGKIDNIDNHKYKIKDLKALEAELYLRKQRGSCRKAKGGE